MSLPEETNSSIGDRNTPQDEDMEVNENGGATGSSDPKTQEQSMVSRRVTRGSVEEDRKNALNLEERLKEEFGAVTKVYRECQEKVRGMTCLKTGANVTEVNEYFKHARSEAQKVWGVMEKVIGQSQNDNDFVMRERGFLRNMGCASLEEVEAAVAMDREKVQEFREILETVKDLEGVNGINELLRKISDERDEFQRDKAGWQNVREELGHLNAIADLKADERLVDRWTSLNDELQALSTKMESLRMEKAKNEGDREKEIKEQAQKIALLEETLDRARAEIVSLGDRNLGKQEEKKAESQRELEEMRRQRLALLDMRETQRCGGTSSPLQSSVESPRIRDPHFSATLRTGGPMGTGIGRNGGGNEFGGGDWRGLENEALASPCQSSSTMATALARPSQPSQIGLTLASPSQPSQPSATLASPSQPGGSEEKVIGRSVGMLANRLPPLAKYAGLKEDWEDFETGFLIRFGAMDKTVAMSLLKNNLIGQAKETLRAVPEDVKSSGIERVLEWLRKKLSHETPFEELEWEKKLRTQAVNGKTVGVVCEELEKYTSKMYIGEEEKKETARRKQLMILYEGRHVEQMRLLSLWSEDASYEKMKSSLVELEYLRKTEKDMRGVGRYGSAGTCSRCGGFGHREAQCTSKVGQGGSNSSGGGYNRGYSGQGTGGGYRSTTQGGRGGFSQNRGGQGWQGGQSGNSGWRGGQQSSTGGGYKWQGGQSNQYSGQRPQGSTSNGATTSATVHGSGKGTGANAVSIDAGRGSPRCSVVRSRGMPIVDKVVEEARRDEKESIKEDDEYFFIKKRERVKGLIGGVLVEALLDTGADVSVISRNVVDKMKGAIVEKGETVEVTDAQGRKMDIIGRILLEVDLEVGTKATVGFYVVNNSLSTVIIGGMGLELIGVELKEVKYNEVEEVKGGGTEMNGGEAIVLRDFEVGPGTLGQVWVTGIEKETVMLECEDDTVVQGVACRERIVSIPVFNDTDKVMQFTKHQSIGKWRVVDRGRVNEVSSGDWRGTSSGIDNQIEWSGIREKLVKNRGEEMNNPLEEVLKGCSEAFAKGDEDIGRLKDWDCTVDVMEGKPVRQKPRPIPFAIREKLRALVDRMMRQGVVKKSQSPWSSPIVVVKKKDGSLRLCIDYRKVNQMIRLDAQPLPHLESTIQSLSGKKFFSTIDLQSGFWQVGLAEGSREVTAFSLLGEHFEFQVLPFGLNVSPCQFQRAMMELLKGTDHPLQLRVCRVQAGPTAKGPSRSSMAYCGERTLQGRECVSIVINTAFRFSRSSVIFTRADKNNADVPATDAELAGLVTDEEDPPSLLRHEDIAPQVVRPMHGIPPPGLAHEQYVLLKNKYEPMSVDTQFLETKCFPWHWPRGFYSVHSPRQIKLTIREMVRWWLACKDRRVAQDPQALAFLHGLLEQKDLTAAMGIQVRLNRGKLFNDVFLKSMADGMAEIEGSFLTSASVMRGHAAYFREKRLDVRAHVALFGPATWFLTLNPAERRWEEVLLQYQTVFGPDTAKNLYEYSARRCEVIGNRKSPRVAKEEVVSRDTLRGLLINSTQIISLSFEGLTI